AGHTSRELPLGYTLSAFWGGQEGSLLLWLLVLTGYGAAAVHLNRHASRDVIAWVVPVIGGVATFFSLLLVAVASPFTTQVAPAENAALRPWLAGTAFLHSVMIQEKRGMLRVWNMVLVSLAFGLSLFGTFLTRSGVLNSIHSFTQSSIGPWFIGFIAIVATFSI